MALTLRPRIIPQCSACLRNYAFAGCAPGQSSTLRQQVRGKKKMPNNSGIMTVRLLKDVEAYGRKGSFVPISPGAMRNAWFPFRIAEYVTVPELKRLRLSNVSTERDFGYEIPKKVKIGRTIHKPATSDTYESHELLSSAQSSDVQQSSIPPPQPARTKAPEIERLTPKRSTELINIFIPPRLEFYRPPIPDEKEPEKAQPVELETPQFGGAAGDLMAARLRQPKEPRATPQPIYGSVTAQDVVVAMRAVLANNDEAARVVLQESEIAFIDLPDLEGSEAGRIKHLGNFSIEVKFRGAEEVVRREVRVLAQEG